MEEEAADRELLELFLEQMLDRYRLGDIELTEAREDLVDLIKILVEGDKENARLFMFNFLEQEALEDIREAAGEAE